MTVRYGSRRPDAPALRERLRALARERRRFGYRRLLIFIRKDVGGTHCLLWGATDDRLQPNGTHYAEGGWAKRVSRRFARTRARSCGQAAKRHAKPSMLAGMQAVSRPNAASGLQSCMRNSFGVLEGRNPNVSRRNRRSQRWDTAPRFLFQNQWAKTTGAIPAEFEPANPRRKNPLLDGCGHPENARSASMPLILAPFR